MTVVACSSSQPAAPVAPTNGGSTSAADGSTLKATPAGGQSPVNDQKLTTDVVLLSATPSVGTFAPGLPLQYHFQVFNPANAVVQEALVANASWQVTATLVGNTRYTWRVRPEYQGQPGPWSGVGSFITREPFVINDPLTNGSTVGRRIGGQFIPGQGWQSGSLTDGIDYDLAQPCRFCTLEFDATNFGGQEGLPFAKDLKWVSMGDAPAFSSFGAFRDHPYKMHLVQRADFPSGMEIIFRNGGTDANGGDPGDHRIKLTSTPINFSSSQVYHFNVTWGMFGYSVAVNGVNIFSDGWDHWYEPASHRIELGCIQRAETIIGIIYRNVTLKANPS